jgi:hypothetical protein
MIPNRYLIESRAERISQWIVAFHLNLLMPGMLGLIITDGPAHWGMLVGIIICLTFGLVLVCSSKHLGTLLIRGAWPVAALQFLPMMHMFIGAVAVAGGSRFNVNVQSHRDVEHLDSFLGGLLANGFTGGALMTISLVAGILLQLVIIVVFDGLSHRHRENRPANSARTIKDHPSPAS